MKLRNIFKSMFAIAIVTSLVSCNDDEDTTRDARVVKPIVTADQTNFTVNEGEDVTITLTTDTPYYRGMSFKLELVGGTGSFRDYTVDGDNDPETDEETVEDDGYGIIGHKVFYPAYATSSTFTISTIIDYLPEATETLVFRLYAMDNANGLVAAESETITVTVNNTILDELQADLTWATTYNAFGNLVTLDYKGMDGKMYDYTDYDYDFVMVGPAVIQTGASGNHPERNTIASTRPDGFYDLIVDLWNTSNAEVPAKLIKFKPVLTISKPGAWVHEMDLSDIWTSDSLGTEDGGDDEKFVGYVEKNGTTFTLYTVDDVVLATGKNNISRKNAKVAINRIK